MLLKKTQDKSRIIRCGAESKYAMYLFANDGKDEVVLQVAEASDRWLYIEVINKKDYDDL